MNPQSRLTILTDYKKITGLGGNQSSFPLEMENLQATILLCSIGLRLGPFVFTAVHFGCGAIKGISRFLIYSVLRRNRPVFD